MAAGSPAGQRLLHPAELRVEDLLAQQVEDLLVAARASSLAHS